MAPRSPPSPTQDSQSYATATYGNVDDGPHVVGEGDDAGSPLLGGPRKISEDDNEREGTATLASGIGKLQYIPQLCNLLNTIVGTGMLSFPMAMASSGIIPGIFTCIFSGVVAAFGLHLLSVCATRTGHRNASFFAVSRMTFPKAAVFFDAAIAIKCFGVSISYLIIIKGLAPNVVKALFHNLWPETEPPAWSLDGRTWVSFFMLILAPLCFLRRLDSLRHTSFVALFSVAYLVVVVVVCYIHPPKGSSPPGEVHLIHFTGHFISTFPVQVFAYTCAQNLFPIYNELYQNTQKRMNLVIGTSIGTAAGIYEVVAILGYLTFGSRIGSNIIAMYPSTSLFIAFGQLAIVILVMFSYPLQVHPCRNCLDKVFGATKKALPAAQNEDDDDETEVSESFDPDHDTGDMSEAKHLWLTVVIVLLGYIVAYFVNSLQMVLSFVGSTGSTTISFILPGILYFKMFRDDNSQSKRKLMLSLALAVYGGAILVFCLSYNIYVVVSGANPTPH